MNYIHNNGILGSHQPSKYTLLTTKVVTTNEWQGLNDKSIRSHLTLACFPIANLSETQKHQQGKTVPV